VIHEFTEACAPNTVAHGHLDLLSDLLVLGASEPWYPARKVRVSRKASKYPFVNLQFGSVRWQYDSRSHTPVEKEQ
jgi:hypothetical protein